MGAVNQVPAVERFIGYETEVPQHECGVYAQLSPEADITFAQMVASAQAIQNRGHDSFGAFLVRKVHDGESSGTASDHRYEGYKNLGSIDDVMALMPVQTGNRLEGHRSDTGVAQVRWGTVYGLSPKQMMDATQPYVQDILGGINGNVENAIFVAAARGVTLEDCPTDSIAMLKVIEQDKKQLNGMIPALERAREDFAGGYAIVVEAEGTLYGMRDPHGIKPLSIGQRANGAYILASESVVFDAEDAAFVRDVNPGEIVELIKTPQGIEILSHPPEVMADEKHCSLEIGYFMRAKSLFRGRPLHELRAELGVQMAQEMAIENPKNYVAIGVPESGLPSARAFAEASGVDYLEDALVKVEDVRSFTAATEDMQHKLAGRKLQVDIKAIVDALFDSQTKIWRKLLILDDSVVRGTQMMNLSAVLRDAGIPQEHLQVVVPFPEINEGCHLGSAIQQEKLLSYQRSHDEKIQRLGVGALAFLSLEGLDKVAPNTCKGCFNGVYPVQPLRTDVVEAPADVIDRHLVRD